jgi:putative transposase
VVISSPDTGKVWKLGSGRSIFIKNKHIRKGLQKQRKYRKAKHIKDRQTKVIRNRNLNHYINKK